MKSESEIGELKDSLNAPKVIKELEEEGFVEYTRRAEFWLECLKWVLKEGK